MKENVHWTKAIDCNCMVIVETASGFEAIINGKSIEIFWHPDEQEDAIKHLKSASLKDTHNYE